jgi:HAE1 family hydrophobic/amphiphilic exporter-1
LNEGVGPSEIRRVDQQRAVVIGADLAAFDLASAVAGIEEVLADVALPLGTSWYVAGQSTEMKEGLASLKFAFAMAVFLVYVILASMFESVIRPLIILVSVPLAGVGAVVALGLAGRPVSVIVGIGFIVLAGIVVNNAIVLVDAVGRRQDEGMGIKEAIETAASMRFRPILITTSTTVLGLLPLALGFGPGAEIQGPLALTVIGGLLSSTLLTLLVLPSFIWLVETARARLSGATP